jgi:NAD(P)-dependent dehydrogenase (short-subunit alcohol dehydrogenase family)
MTHTPLPRRALLETPFWQGKNVLVAGATGAFGAALAQACGSAGATVILAGKSVKSLERRFDQLVAAQCPEPAIYPIDFLGAQGKDYDDLADRLVAELGGIDVMIWAIGFWHGLEPVANVQAQNWFKTLHLNLTAPQLLLQACFASLRERAGCAVFPLQSPSVTQLAFSGAYGAAQAGLRNYLISSADECERFGPKILGVELPALKSRLRLAAFPAEDATQLVHPDAIAPAVMRLIESGAIGLHRVAA